MKVAELVQFLQSTNQEAEIIIDVLGCYPTYEIKHTWAGENSSDFVTLTVEQSPSRT